MEGQFKFNLLFDGMYNFWFEGKINLFKGVMVIFNKFDGVQSMKMGFEWLIIKGIEEIFLVFGEKDILKVVSLLVGVQFVGEGIVGFNVRGSLVDQNLFYIDKVFIYNILYLLGFFFVFNLDVISEFFIFKSNILVKFGGWLVFIFDIIVFEGDKEKYKVWGGISLIIGNILFEGLVQKDKSFIMVVVWFIYFNWILKWIQNDDFNWICVNFVDGIVKFFQQLFFKSRIQAFGYYSFDDINFVGIINFDNSNLGGFLLWNYFFNEKINMNLAVINSCMQLGVAEWGIFFEVYWQNSEFLYQEVCMDWAWCINFWYELIFGVNVILYNNDWGIFFFLMIGV